MKCKHCDKEVKHEDEHYKDVGTLSKSTTTIEIWALVDCSRTYGRLDIQRTLGS